MNLIPPLIGIATLYGTIITGTALLIIKRILKSLNVSKEIDFNTCER